MIINSPINPNAFYIFNYPVKFYGIIMSLSILLGMILAISLFKKNSTQNEEIFIDSLPITIFSAIFGARLFYILGQYNYFINNPKEIIMINHGGISILGAIVFGIMGLLIYSKIKKNNFLHFADFYALAIPFCQAIGRWGNFFNQEAYGMPSNSFLKLYIDKSHRYNDFLNIDYYHPTFLYESILDIIIFIILIFYFYKKQNKNYGEIFYLYLILYSIIRIFMEQIRIDSILNIGNFSSATIICAIIFIVSLIKYKKIAQK